MRLLILGGSVFLGRALTDAALDKGHAVTHFRRGTSGAPDSRVETILGDRTGTLEALDARAFDAVADTSGYLPQDVRRSAEKLRDKAGRYLFVSSISSGSDARFEWIHAAFLAAHGARHWTKMPLQVPEDDAAMKGFASVCVARALAEGLRFRSQAQTVADTLAWSRTRPSGPAWKAGLTADEERALLADWDVAKRSRGDAKA